MNIAIVGAGIAGISTALELARDGHQVTIYEQMNAAAEDASFAPGGWLSPFATQNLAAPDSGMPLKQLRNGADLLLGSNMIGTPTWRWMRQWKKQEKLASKQDRYTPSRALATLNTYSNSLRWENCADPEVTAERKLGALVVLRTQNEVDFWATRLQKLQEQGTPCKLLKPSEAQTLEPGLSQEISWTGALHFPQGESINARLWAHHLRMQGQEIGVRFLTGSPVTKIHTSPVGLSYAGQQHNFDHIVLCTGANQQLIQTLGIQLPAMPIWGYSVTAPVRDPLQAPRTAIMDWSQQATISRMGQRVRITAGLEMGEASNTPHHNPTLQRMYQLLNDWFPGGAHLSSTQVQVWRGARAYLPDGLPAMGSSGHTGIWLNLAHGSHGVSLAAGCARAIADTINAHTPAIDMQAFSPLRF